MDILIHGLGPVLDLGDLGLLDVEVPGQRVLGEGKALRSSARVMS